MVMAAAWPAAGSAEAATPPLPLPYLHVVVPGPGSASGPGGTGNPYLADPSGRQILLHGVDVVGIQDNFYAGGDGKPALYPDDAAAYTDRCPSDSSLEDEFPVCEVGALKGEWVSTAAGSGNDVAQIRQQGFDTVRLAISWSLLEPTPGHYSTTYLDRIGQFVQWAGQQGIYVILDMHEDQYSRYVLPAKGTALPSGCTKSTGNDGAPAWAVFTDGKPACALLGQSAINPAASAATYEFFNNHAVPGPKGSSPGTGLEDHYIEALAFLAQRFDDNPTVLGYEIMNEPPLGSLSPLPLGNLYDASSQQLYPFYKRVIEALTGVRDGLPTCPADQPTSLSGSCAYPQLAHVSRQSVFYEPLGLRNLFDFSPQVSAPFSSYPNLVYAPHIYTHVFTADASFLGVPVGQSPYPPSYTFGYATAQAEGTAMHSAVFVTEFGNAPSDDATLLAGMTQAQQIALVGGSLWAWSGNTTDRSLGSCWAVYCRYSGPSQTPGHQPKTTEHLMASRVTYLDRVFPRATAGTLLSYADDPTTTAFTMVATDASAVHVGDRAAETTVYLPVRAGHQVVVSGAAVLDAVVSRPDGSRLAYVAPTGRGRYTVRVGPPDPTVQSAAVQRASSPLAPITEPQARAQLQAGLAQIAMSNNPKIRSAAGEAPALLGALFGTGPDPNAGS
jgi:hypothetical protein